jgi:hypothetical protein
MRIENGLGFYNGCIGFFMDMFAVISLQGRILNIAGFVRERYRLLVS